MTVTFEAEDGTGISTATSYASLDTFKQYWFDNNYNYGSMTDNDIKRLLNKASKYIDNNYRQSFPGYRQDDEQALEWPRSSAYYLDDYTIDEDTVPSEIVAATCETTYLLYTGTDITATISKNGVVTSSSVKVDVIEEAYTYSEGFTTDIYVIIDNMLSRITGGVNDRFVVKAIRVGGESP